MQGTQVQEHNGLSVIPGVSKKTSLKLKVIYTLFWKQGILQIFRKNCLVYLTSSVKICIPGINYSEIIRIFQIQHVYIIDVNLIV